MNEIDPRAEYGWPLTAAAEQIRYCDVVLASHIVRAAVAADLVGGHLITDPANERAMNLLVAVRAELSDELDTFEHETESLHAVYLTGLARHRVQSGRELSDMLQRMISARNEPDTVRTSAGELRDVAKKAANLSSV